MLCEIVSERLHLFIGCSVKVHIRYFMEPDKVHPAIETFGKPHYFPCMHHRIVYSFKHDVFKRQPALVCEIILMHKRDDVFYRHSLFCRHQLRTLFRYRRVHADSHMTLAFVKEALKFVFHSYATHGYSLRTPLEAIFLCQNLCHSKHIVEIVHRLTLSHKYYIGEFFPFRQ